MSDWRPAASFEVLRLRAEVLASIRSFFAERGVMEVETPVLAGATVTDVHLHSMSCCFAGAAASESRELFLQTSPEFHMKRLLAAGSGPIYQLARAFRDGEAGRRHNPEFTLLEWYRPGWDHHRLVDEIEDLLSSVLGTGRCERLTYREAFLRHLDLDPFAASDDELALSLRSIGVDDSSRLDRDDLLNLLLARVVEPELGRDTPTVVHDFPASQAALARVRPEEPPVAERFEIFVEGVELANGYHELVDADEQRRRFEADLDVRRRRCLLDITPDEQLLAALEHGLPECAGVALGIDRLMMLAAEADDIGDVIAFPIDRA